ncbi:MAG TPA: hypothetical protein VIQ54_17335, partial [Polyangia bacterium]
VTYLRRSVAPPIVNSIAAASRALAEARGENIDVTKWLAATHLSAARVIMSEPIPLTPIPVQKRLLDLVAFSVTDDYFACRKHLGLTVA